MFKERKQGDIEENVGEVFVGDDASVHCNNERLLAELRDVLEDPAQVCELQRNSGCDLAMCGSKPHSGRPRASTHANHVLF